MARASNGYCSTPERRAPSSILYHELAGRSVAASGSLLMIQSPKGRPMIVALSAHAATERIPASHQPTRMNQITRRIRFGGLTAAIWTRDADCSPSLMALVSFQDSFTSTGIYQRV